MRADRDAQGGTSLKVPLANCMTLSSCAIGCRYGISATSSVSRKRETVLFIMRQCCIALTDAVDRINRITLTTQISWRTKVLYLTVSQ